jgi:hypothetical protein
VQLRKNTNNNGDNLAEWAAQSRAKGKAVKQLSQNNREIPPSLKP